MNEMRPQVIIISGPNGARKTTLAPFLLQDRYEEFPFVNFRLLDLKASQSKQDV